MPNRGPGYKKNRRYTPSVKKARRDTTRSMIARNVSSGFPDSIRMKHKYVETSTVFIAGGSSGYVAYRANGMYDPSTAAGGHQPLYFDQISALYNHFAVEYCTIKATFFSNGTAAPGGVYMCSITLQDDGTPGITTYDSILEHGTAKVKPLMTRDGGGMCQIKHKFNARSFFDIKTVDDNDEQKGTPASDPTEQAHFIVQAQHLDPAAANSNIYVNVELIYTATWSERRDVAQS